MKKLLFVLALGAFAASCGNGSTEKTNADSTLAAPAQDSAVTPAPATDSTHAAAPAADSAHTATADSTHAAK